MYKYKYVCSVQCTGIIDTIQYTVHSVHCVLHSVQYCTVYTKIYTLYKNLYIIQHTELWQLFKTELLWELENSLTSVTVSNISGVTV